MYIPPNQIEAAVGEAVPMPDLWSRLARLNGRCVSSLESLQAIVLSHTSLHWRVIIRLRGEPLDSPVISIVRARAADALEQGLEEAEARGWHLPIGVLPAP